MLTADATPAVPAEIVQQAEHPTAGLNSASSPPPITLVPQQPTLPPIVNPGPASQNLLPQQAEVKAEVKAAEEHLAPYIGGKISPKLTPHLMLTLKEDPVGQYAGLKLCFQGPMITGNDGILLGEQVVEALKTHPQFSKLLAEDPSRIRFMKPIDPAEYDMVHVHVNGMSASQYEQLLQGLAKNPAVASGEALHAQGDDSGKVKEIPTTEIPKLAATGDLAETPVTPKPDDKAETAALAETSAVGAPDDTSITLPATALDRVAAVPEVGAEVS